MKKCNILQMLCQQRDRNRYEAAIEKMSDQPAIYQWLAVFPNEIYISPCKVNQFLYGIVGFIVNVSFGCAVSRSAPSQVIEKQEIICNLDLFWSAIECKSCLFHAFESLNEDYVTSTKDQDLVKRKIKIL